MTLQLFVSRRETGRRRLSRLRRLPAGRHSRSLAQNHVGQLRALHHRAASAPAATSSATSNRCAASLCRPSAAVCSAGRPARIIAFRNEKEYQPYRPNEFATAFYQPGAVHDFIVMSSASSEHYPVADPRVHASDDSPVGMEVPPWLNEGLAELYSSLEPRGDRILVGQVIPGRVQVLRTGEWIPLATLLAVDHNSPYYNEKSRAGMFYAESWALVHMLNLDPEYRPHLNALVAALKDETIRRPPSPRPTASSIDEVEAALRTYFNAATIHAELFNVQLPKSVDAPEISPRRRCPPASRWPNLLGNTSRPRRTGARRLRTVGQRLSGPLGGGSGPRREFAWRQRKLGRRGRSHFARAVELGCKNRTEPAALRPRPRLYDRRQGSRRRTEQGRPPLPGFRRGQPGTWRDPCAHRRLRRQPRRARRP